MATAKKRSDDGQRPMRLRYARGEIQNLLGWELEQAGMASLASAMWSAANEASRGKELPDWRLKATVLAESRMVETNGGGRLERVEGFNSQRAVADGLTLPLARAGIPARYAESSRTGVRFETVKDIDDRVQILSTSSVPWRCVCHLVIEREDGSETYGTGWIAGARVIATAGHCIFDPKGGGRATRIHIIPGRNGSEAPFGVLQAASVHVDERWLERQDERFDWGALFVKDYQFRDRIGYFGFGTFPDAELKGHLANIGGYAFAKSPFGTLWFNAGRVEDVDEHFLYYLIDTSEGDSGSPLFHYGAQEERIALGIHTIGHSFNRAVRITPEIRDALTAWRNS